MMRYRTIIGAAAALVLACAIPASAQSTYYPAGYETWNCGNTSNRMVLTFDDAPGDHGSYRTYNDTLYLGAWLKTQNIRAMFFLTTGPMGAAGRTDIIAKLRAQGHYVGNHSVNHPSFYTINDAQVKAEVDGGVQGNIIRPPSGDYTPHHKELLRQWGYRVCTWHRNLSTHDWESGDGQRGLRSTASIREIVSKGRDSSGGIILGHLWTNYPDAIPGIVDDMHAQGKLFCRNRGPVTATVPFPLSCT